MTRRWDSRIGLELNVPIYLSTGAHDKIAGGDWPEKVAASMKATGLRHIRRESFNGGHGVNKDEVSKALDWFRELAR